MPVSYVPVTIPDAATYTVKRSNSGVTHYVPNLTATCTITLPTPEVGLSFTFAYAGVAADAQNWVITTGSDTYYFIGGIQFIDNDTDVVAPVQPDGNSNSKMTVVTPDVGTRVLFECVNGTLWNLSGFVGSATVLTFADQ